MGLQMGSKQAANQGIQCVTLLDLMAFVSHCLEHTVYPCDWRVVKSFVLLFQTIIMVIVLLTFTILSAPLCLWDCCPSCLIVSFSLQDLSRRRRKKNLQGKKSALQNTLFSSFFFGNKGLDQQTDNGSTLTKSTCLHYRFDLGSWLKGGGATQIQISSSYNI